MSTLALARPSKSVAVTVLGLSTLLWGGAYAAWGGYFIFEGAAVLGHLWATAPVDGDFQRSFAHLAVVVGVVILLRGVLGLLGGLGVLMRKQWGRLLTLIVAVLAIWGGLHSLGGRYPAIATAQLLYGILAFVVLRKNSAEFSRPRV